MTKGKRLRFFSAALAVALALAACGGQVVEDGDGPSGGGGSSSGGSWSGGAAATGGDAATGGVPYSEEPCPNAPVPEPDITCDPLEPQLDCAVGTGCYASLIYPSEKCGHPQYVAHCLYAGTGEQGDLCNSIEDCQPGFMCVVGTGAGARCAQLCATTPGSAGCVHPFVCGETDVPGYGVCN